MINTLFSLQLNQKEKTAFNKHLVYVMLEGVILGVLALNEFVFIKSLQGTNYQLGFLFQFSMVLFVFLILINEFIKRVRSRKKLLRVVAWTTRLPLALIAFFPHSANQTSTTCLKIAIGIQILASYTAMPQRLTKL